MNWDLIKNGNGFKFEEKPDKIKYRIKSGQTFYFDEACCNAGLTARKA